jgi:putative ABC transport system substrate-binding protein
LFKARVGEAIASSEARTPGDLPIERATEAAFKTPLETGKARGLDIPPTLLANADKVIE